MYQEWLSQVHESKLELLGIQNDLEIMSIRYFCTNIEAKNTWFFRDKNIMVTIFIL